MKITEIKAHDGPCFACDFSHSKFGSLLLTCGYDKKVYLWGEMNGQYDKVYEYTKHTNIVTCGCFDNQNESELLFVTGDLNGGICIHEYKNSNFVTKEFNAHGFGVNSISFFSKGNNFITCGNDGVIKYWFFDNEWKETEIETIDSIVKDVACRNNADFEFVSGSEDGTLLYWKKINDNWEKKAITTCESPISKLSWNDNGNTLTLIDSEGEQQIFTQEAFED